MFSFRVLGAAQLRNGEGEELSGVVAQPKRLALLAYLVLARPRGPHRRDSVIALFWPELDAEGARNSLSQAVHFLRRAIGDVLPGRHGDVIEVDYGRLWCDAVALEAAIDAGRLDEAVALYGGPLLEGLHIAGAPEFDRWLDAERARLDTLHASALEALAGQRERQDDFPGAIEVWQKAAARDPYDSRVALRLMRALAASGNPAGAIRHARIHDTLLRAELDVAPDRRIDAFLASLHDRSAASARHAASEERPAGIVADASPPEELAATARPITAGHVSPQPRGEPSLQSTSADSSTSRSLGAFDRGVRRRSVLLAAAVIAAVLLPSVVSVIGGAASTPGEEPLAMQAYELGRQQELSRSRLGLQSAEAYYREAIARKPDFALGYAGLARVYGHRADYAFSRAGPALDSARRMAEHAYRLDSTLSRTRIALAISLGDAGHFAAAEAEIRRALAADSLDADAHYWYSVLLVALGRGNEAMEHVLIAKRLDPLGPRGHVAMERYARYLIDSTRPHRALPPRQRRPILQFQPGEPWARAQEAIELAEVGECPDAYGELAQATSLTSPDNMRLSPAVGTVHWLCGDKRTARDVLERMKKHPDANDHGYRVAMLHLAMAENDSALVWLRRQRWTMAQLSGLSAGYVIDPLRSDPRFHQLMREIGVRP